MIVMLDTAIVASAAHERGVIAARPIEAERESKPRTGDITLSSTRVFVPESYRHDRPAGVLVMLHGADGKAEQALGFVRELASRANMIVIAPKSAHTSWDVIRTELGPDVARIDRALASVFAAYTIDPARVAIGGFSDGASYALTLGQANGELFQTILAFSPGFEAAPRRQGKPRVFISHGTTDKILPIDRTSRRLVARLEKRGLEVEYVEFDGGHAVPDEAARSALRRLGRRDAVDLGNAARIDAPAPDSAHPG
jgi:phospholipase/carboxylesterase